MVAVNLFVAYAIPKKVAEKADLIRLLGQTHEPRKNLLPGVKKGVPHQSQVVCPQIDFIYSRHEERPTKPPVPPA